MKTAQKVYKFIVIIIILFSVPVSVYFLNQKTNFFNKAKQALFGTKANFVVNLTDSYPFSPPWTNLAQGGEEKGGMLNAVTPQIKNLRPEYIRIDHVYDFYEPVKRDSSGSLIFDWTGLDEEIKDILATGAKPFLSLSYMPPSLSSGGVTDLPRSYDEWQTLVQKTIEHVSGRSGLAISDVYYEIWNEPDLFGNFKLSPPKNYLDLYYHASLGALQAKYTLAFKIGGPATSSLYKSWFDSFFNFAQKKALRVDFYSWHRYSKNLTDYEGDILKAKDWILAYPSYKDVEFIISEAGHSSENDKAYDEVFSAIHTIGLFVSTFEKIGKIFTFEIKDGPGGEKYWGRWGILTHEKFGTPEPKPRYKGLEFLNQMRGSWHPVYGQGTFVKGLVTKSQDSGVIKVLLVNYDPYGVHSETVPVTFVNSPFQNFSLRRTDFLGGTSETVLEGILGEWKTQVPMKPNTSLILEIIPI